MSRILDFTPSQEEAVVARVLVLVHQAMDEHLPYAGQANRQFTKTIFSGSDERTSGTIPAAPDFDDVAAQSAFGSKEATSPDGQPGTISSDTPQMSRPKPEVKKPADYITVSSTAELSNSLPLPSMQPSSIEQEIGSLYSTMRSAKKAQGPDWVTRITLALLIAGLVLLSYVLIT